MGFVVGMQRILVARNWTLWCRFLGDWSNEEEYYTDGEDNDSESCWSAECVVGTW